MILAIMIGLLFATMMLTNRADKVGYAKLEGRPGAAISVLGNVSKAGFQLPAGAGVGRSEDQGCHLAWHRL